MSTLEVHDINSRIKKSESLLKAIESPNFNDLIEKLNINWITGSVDEDSDIFSVFIENGLINKEGKTLTRAGILFCSRVTIDFESELSNHRVLENKYRIIKTIQIGKNSCTFLSEHVILGTQIILKFLRPGASDEITKALKLISSSNIPSLINPIDYFKVKIRNIYLKEVEIECIVFPYITGISLKEFLNNEHKPLNAHAISSFIRQVGGVLYNLESHGAYHGDLHEENIIVNTSRSGALTFNVIDVSYGVTGSLSSDICKDNDLKLFRQHVWNFLSSQQRFLAKMSIRKYLGSEIFYIVKTVMSPETKNFKVIIELYKDNYAHKKYKIEKSEFIEQKFKHPGTFKLQRYEEITNQKVALKLFVPFREVMDPMEIFSNVVLTGNRGTGKSTYLAALAFFPQVTEPFVNFKEIFGIYFPCRQGEFRLLSSDIVDYSELGLRRVKHVLIIKIIRRTLEAIADGIEFKKIYERPEYDLIKDFLTMFLEQDEIISLDSEIVSEIRNLVSIMVRIEMKELDNLFNLKPFIGSKLASEIDVLNFFKTLQICFPELSNTRFHLLFDDAGKPNIPVETQYIINDFIISSNSVYCVKLTTEKYSFEYQTTSKKIIESGHDYYEYDLNRIFFTGAKTFGLDQGKLQNYFYQIIEKRLLYFEYKSDNIQDYLGNDPFKFQNLINSLATGKRNAYYCGWEMVWRIADKVPRNLLELISEIFSIANVKKNTSPNIISNRNQDRGIRAVSEKRLRSIGQIPGAITIFGNRMSLGRRLFEITQTIGSVYRIYLLSEKGKKKKDQYLAIERNDFSEISVAAEQLLKELIRFGIFDESRLDYSRDDRVKKPIYILNRIYCPTFAISIQRDQHLRLSRKKFEELFLFPQKFLIDGTHRLRVVNPQKINEQQSLYFNQTE